MSPVRGWSPQAEALTCWGIAFAAVVIARLTVPQYAAGVATVAFLYVPVYFMRRRDQDHRDLGVTFAAWRADLKWFALLAAIVTPLYFLGYWAFAEGLRLLPAWLVALLSPYEGGVRFAPSLPDDFALWVLHHFLVVALPEEFFYRGYLQDRFKAAWPPTRRVLGVPVGRAFLLTAVLFAVGHLAVFEVWRLSVFFPALLFGFLRERTGTVLGATLLHGYFNLYEMVLRASLLGLP